MRDVSDEALFWQRSRNGFATFLVKEKKCRRPSHASTRPRRCAAWAWLCRIAGGGPSRPRGLDQPAGRVYPDRLFPARRPRSRCACRRCSAPRHILFIGPDRRPLKMVLLSPAGRPVQVTTDLPGFWDGSLRRGAQGRCARATRGIPGPTTRAAPIRPCAQNRGANRPPGRAEHVLRIARSGTLRLPLADLRARQGDARRKGCRMKDGSGAAGQGTGSAGRRAYSCAGRAAHGGCGPCRACGLTLITPRPDRPFIPACPAGACRGALRTRGARYRHPLVRLARFALARG